MKERVVRLFCQKKKLASASFANLQFWTEGKWHHCMDQTYSNGFTLLDLRVLQGGLQAREGIKKKRASKNMVAVQIIKLDQNENEVDSLKFFKGQNWVFP